MNVIKNKWHNDWFQLFLEHHSTHPHDIDWVFISSNENLLPEMVIQYPSFPWSWNALCSNPNMTISFITKWMINKNHNCNWFSLSKNSRISVKDVSQHPELPWDWKGLSRNPTILSDHDFVKQNLSKMDKEQLIKTMPVSFLMFHSFHYFFSYIFWKCISSNPTLTTQFVLDNLQEEWYWPALSCHSSFTPEFIEIHPDFQWNWKAIGYNDSITPEFVERHIHKNWDWSKLSQNPRMIPLIISNPDYPWDWGMVSANPSLTKELVSQFKDKEWNWRSLATFLPITKDDLDEEYKHISYNFLSINVNVSPNLIRQMKSQQWKWRILCANTMRLSRTTYIEKETCKYLRQVKDEIEAELMEIAWKPERLQWVLDNEQKSLYTIE